MYVFDQHILSENTFLSSTASMAPYRPFLQSGTNSSEDFGEESAALMTESEKVVHHSTCSQKTHVGVLYFIIITLVVGLAIAPKWRFDKCQDPSIGLWSPAQDVVSYKTVEFDKYFLNRSPYTQTPSREIDEMWEDLYNFGLSGISPQEASELYDPTVHLPHDNSTYIITLGVFHELHCVNNLRKALYPDEYPGLWKYNADGTVNHNHNIAYHWDHCLDILRQTLMCQADITPMPFFYRSSDDNVYSVLASTHTCRDFEKVKNWALERQLHHWLWNQTTDQDIIA